MPLTNPQCIIANTNTRFRVIIAGRRFGKTYFGIRELARFARTPDSTVVYFAPTHEQAKDIAWQQLKAQLIRFQWSDKFNEKELRAYLKNNSTITVGGLANFRFKRGRGWDFVVLDEFAFMHPDAWNYVVRPALSDKKGHALFIGTPEGRNWAYDFYRKGQDANDTDWTSWQFTTADGGNVDTDEIEAARQELDPLTFEQEYLASFVNFEGQAYYPFDRDIHIAALPYQSRDDLIICFDFNVSPGVAVIAQEQRLPSGLQGTAIIGEVHIAKNSNTPAVCSQLIRNWQHHKGRVICYGDASGAASGTAKVSGSDWDLIREQLAPVFGNRLSFDIPRANPKIRTRINAMNSRLKSTSGDIKMMVDPKCKNLIADFESVRLKKGSNEIDKNYDSRFTHMTDALGYYVVREFPVSGPSVVLSRASIYS